MKKAQLIAIFFLTTIIFLSIGGSAGAQPYQLEKDPTNDPDSVKDGAYWGSYNDFIARSLTVDYLIRDTGLDGPYNLKICSLWVTQGVTCTTSMPIFSTLSPHDFVRFELKYMVPLGVGSFWTGFYVDSWAIGYTPPAWWASSC